MVIVAFCLVRLREEFPRLFPGDLCVMVGVRRYRVKI